MDSFEFLPDMEITSSKNISGKFLELGINTFKQACLYVHNLEYGYNSTYKDEYILFKEKKGSCTTKHAVIAGLASELGIPLNKRVGIYEFTEEISTGAQKILEKYDLPFIPMVHCFLVYKNYQFDLTDGNKNGKKKALENFLYTEDVEAFISRIDEYKLYKRVLKGKILKNELKGKEEKTILKAREESILLLKELIN